MQTQNQHLLFAQSCPAYFNQWIDLYNSRFRKYEKLRIVVLSDKRFPVDTGHTDDIGQNDGGV